MPRAAQILISEEEERQLHAQLLKGDPTASADLAIKLLNPLIGWLVRHNSSDVHEHFCVEAAEDALIALIKRPSSFDRARGKRLFSYLCMAAQRDLQNIFRREGRQRRNQESLQDVELSPGAGKYLAKGADQLRLLEIQEESTRASAEVVSPARDGLTDAESRALDLVLQGERKTAVFAEVLGITDLPKKAQQAEVKRVKDKLKIRIKRGTSSDGQPS